MSHENKQVLLKVVGSAFADQPDDAGIESDSQTLLEMFTDGSVFAYSGKVEYGQGIRSGFAGMIGSVLGRDPAEVNVVLADTARVPFDRGTTGSASTRTVGVQLVRAASALKAELFRRAAVRFGVSESELGLNFDAVSSLDKSHSIAVNELLETDRIQIPISDEDVVDDVFALASTNAGSPRIDAVDRVTGRAKYGHDFSLENTAFGRIIRPPAMGAKLLRIDAARAMQVPGFIQLVETSELIGVVAETQEAVDRAASFVRTRWDEPDDDVSDWSLPAALKDRANEPVILREEGSVDDDLDNAERVISGVYYAPYIANAQMEPSAATARWDNDDSQLTVWCSNRAPFGERANLAESLGIAPEAIHVITQEVGGSFGTKSQSVSLEAAILARESGKAVKVAYTREEEFGTSTVRPAALMEISAGVDSNGKLMAWDYSAIHAGDNAFRGRRGADSPYDAPGTRIRVADSPSPLAGGSYRSLGGAVNHFGREVHIDAIARELEFDPLEFRLTNLSHPRYRRVLEKVAEMSGWNSRSSNEPGVGFGLAVGFDAGSYVAQVARVRVDGSNVVVERVDVAFDCGQVFNPDGAINQIEGSVVMGMGTALWESVEFDAGRVLSTGFDTYRVPRITDVPEIHVEFIDDASNEPTGAGEPGIVTVAASIVNAVVDATGKAIDRLPISSQL